MAELEKLVLDYVREQDRTYTRSMYVFLKIKHQFGLSLNGFRKQLHILVDQNKLQCKFDGHFSYWTLKKD